METVDTALNARWIVPIEPDNQVLENHSLLINKGRIVDLLPSADANTKYHITEHIALDKHVVLPGLVNAHTHAAMSLMRGMADDLPLMEWLNEHIWPTEARCISADYVRDGTRLAIAEMLRGGITCFNDMYFFPDIVADTAQACGIRAVIGLIVIDFASAWAADVDEYLGKGLALYEHLKQQKAADETFLIHCALAPHAPYTVSDKPLQRIRDLAIDHDLVIHMHVHETAFEVEQCLQQRGCRPLEHLDRLGLLTPRLAAVHMTQLNNAEIERIAEAGLSVLHCPESNLKLASGFCPLAALDAAGVNIAIGTDGAASNNDLDMFGEMKTAALLAKAVAQDAAAIPAQQALRMATLNGARALGLADQIGSLQIGKWADVIAVDLAYPETEPVYHPISQLVYASSRQQVSDVWIAGQRVLNNRRLTTMDDTEVCQQARYWHQQIVGN